MPVYRLSTLSQADITRLLAWTSDRFGDMARRRYEALLITALRDLAADPGRNGTIPRPELGESVRSYHNRARTAKGMVRAPRHLLLYRVLHPDIIGIGRVLHDSMELERHLPEDYGDE